MKKKKILYLVIPCYNEEEVIDETCYRLKEKLNDLIEKKEISDKSKIMFVNDGSKDNTWQKILDYHNKNSLVTGICLSNNRGHQNALLAGLMIAKKYADVVISMDADLQDDINAIDEMIKKFYEGNDIVYGVRSKRKTDTFFKRFTAELFYKFMKILGVNIIYNHADYRLASKRVLDNLENYEEVNLFLRGLFPLIGFSHDVVYYERKERFAGESKYPLKKMLAFAWDGITSFSVKPIKLLLSFGIILFIINIFLILYFIIYSFFNVIDKFNILLCLILLMFSIQIISIGIIGEYVGKIYAEVKHRPRYIILENLEEDI